MQLVDVEIDHRQPGGTASISTDVNKEVLSQSLSLGVNTFEVLVPKVISDKAIKVKVVVKGVLTKKKSLC
jgi:hypothetical protein